MSEKDPPSRLRRAVKENNLFLVKRLVQKTDMRNPDPAPRRLTSLAWAALLGHEETFEYLLSSGHDDRELSRDSENNTILMILADAGLPVNLYPSTATTLDFNSATLRMARQYYERYQPNYHDILDWANIHGRTALHLAAVKGNEDLVRMFCDLNADINLSDNQGNTPLHYASAWGHVSIIQLLIERGCNYNLRNNQGFIASDYAYSFSTQEMQKTAEKQYELTKKSRRAAVQNGRNLDWTGSAPINVPLGSIPRTRSGSGTSRTTTTSDSGDMDSHTLSLTASSSPSQPSAGSGSNLRSSGHPASHVASVNSLGAPSGVTASTNASSINLSTVFAPIANRVRERDADAMEKYMRRNRSGSSSTDKQTQGGFHHTNGPRPSGLSTPRLLRPSASAAQLRTTYESPVVTVSEPRSRAGTNPSFSKLAPIPAPILTRSTSSSNALGDPESQESSKGEEESYYGPPSQYAQFPEPPPLTEDSSTPTAARRRAFHILPKSSHADLSSNHRRGMSATAAMRGP